MATGTRSLWLRRKVSRNCPKQIREKQRALTNAQHDEMWKILNRTRPPPPPPENIKINDFRMPRSQPVMYLGVRLDSRLSMKGHISNTIEKFTTARSAPGYVSRSSSRLEIVYERAHFQHHRKVYNSQERPLHAPVAEE
ncbi:hypothetical protein QE152_g19252 [Popillia japonica]|uniref:Uncharacterized protein n=1 Tax=Popillia japonica TaxID=7064 RepID=A0AAW1KST7_POPJA